MYLNKQTFEQNMSVTTEQKNLHLLPHNREAYEKVMAHFESHQRAAIVHATGTGKSYCIAAIASHFSKVLVMAPNNFVLNETQKVCNEGVEFRTYASSIYDEVPSTGYDLIVLDEFHRAGAPEWGYAVRKILRANQQAKILGTSATHIRYLDHERDMAKELFDGNIISYLSLSEALDKKILPSPIYVSSLFDVSDSIDKLKKHVKVSKTISEGEKKDYYLHLEHLTDSWEKAHGVPVIIKKYFNSKMKRIIVFCSKVKRTTEARKLLGSWLASAGYKNIRFYNFDYTEKHLSKEMEDFQADNYDGIKVAISVNMLNEGIHVPHIDAIIMLRSTISRVIIEQQVGRCLTADNCNLSPVVLDLVNNMDTVLAEWGKGYFYSDSSIDNSNVDSTQKEHFPFKVIDECKDFRELYDQLRSSVEGVDSLEGQFLRFVAQENRLPSLRENKSLYNFYSNVRRKEDLQLRYPRTWAVVKKLCPETPKDKIVRYRKELLIWMDEHNRIPLAVGKKEKTEEYVMSVRLRSYFISKTLHEWIVEELTKRNLEFNIDSYTRDDLPKRWKNVIKTWLDEHPGDFPKCKSSVGSAYKKLRKYAEDNGDIEILDWFDEIGMTEAMRYSPAQRLTLETAKEFVAFCKDKGRLPDTTEPYYSNWKGYRYYLQTNTMSQPLRKILTDGGIIDGNKILLKQIPRNYLIVKINKFIKANHRIPHPGDDLYIKVVSRLSILRRKGKNDDELIVYCKKIGLHALGSHNIYRFENIAKSFADYAYSHDKKDLFATYESKRRVIAWAKKINGGVFSEDEMEIIKALKILDRLKEFGVVR